MTVHGSCHALLKFICLMLCLGSFGCRPEANATKDLVDAFVCFISRVAGVESQLGITVNWVLQPIELGTVPI